MSITCRSADLSTDEVIFCRFFSLSFILKINKLKEEINNRRKSYPLFDRPKLSTFCSAFGPRPQTIKKIDFPWISDRRIKIAFFMRRTICQEKVIVFSQRVFNSFSAASGAEMFISRKAVS